MKFYIIRVYFLKGDAQYIALTPTLCEPYSFVGNKKLAAKIPHHKISEVISFITQKHTFAHKIEVMYCKGYEI